MTTNLALPFYSHAQCRPEALALSVNQRDFTYGELTELSQRIASWLQSTAEVKLVGILASRSWEAYAGLLGACWAGAAYVPLNPDWPAARLLSILEATELDAMVVDDRGLRLLTGEVLQHAPKRILAPGHSSSFVLGSSPASVPVAAFDALPSPNPHLAPRTLHAHDLAYIMFTSGSTGSAKGVMVSIGNVFAFLSAMQERYPFAPKDRIAHRHELSFDFSVLDLFITWLSGASLHVIPASQLIGPSRFIRERQPTVWFSVPSAVAFMRDMKMLTPGAFPSLRYSAFCGEPLPAASVTAWQKACPNSVLDNIYGPTEATVACLGQICSEPLVVTQERGTIAIGKPFRGTNAAVVDSSFNFLPAGEHGELALSGPQLAQGYFKDPQKTAARFPQVNGKRWYLTGDLAYRDASDRFHYLGRTDNQVKVLGYRVELDEVEAHLREVCGVDSVAAVLRPIPTGSANTIVAFVSGSHLAASEIREKMQRRLPKYMVPAEVRFLPQLPLSLSGKTDRKSLTLMLSEVSR